MAFPSRPSHYIAFVVCWSFLVASVAFAVSPESRSLLPAAGTTAAPDRSPAEAGLESGRYREISKEDVEKWERDQDSKSDREPSSEKKPASANTPF
ncbi:MAG: hypothetical protein KF767_04045 [Bdellovibrionaceae bacterium]|nr:hypothetical protein [Pseudobdellovibrionaceae bacterium]